MTNANAPSLERDEVVARLRSHRSALNTLGVKSLELFGSVARGEAPGGTSDSCRMTESRQAEASHTGSVAGGVRCLAESGVKRHQLAGKLACEPEIACVIAGELSLECQSHDRLMVDRDCRDGELSEQPERR
jgi:hypothetical protein